MIAVNESTITDLTLESIVEDIIEYDFDLLIENFIHDRNRWFASLDMSDSYIRVCTEADVLEDLYEVHDHVTAFEFVMTNSSHNFGLIEKYFQNFEHVLSEMKTNFYDDAEADLLIYTFLSR